MACSLGAVDPRVWRHPISGCGSGEASLNQDTTTRRSKMYQRARVHGRRLCSGVTGVCLLLLLAIGRAKAGPLPPPPPVPLAPPLLNGTLLLNLTPRVDFVDFGNYSVFQPEPAPFEGD